MRTAWIVIVAGLGLPLYAYVGYPILLFLLASFVQAARDVYYLVWRRDRRARHPAPPSVSVIIAAHNEEGVIGSTLECALSLDYPAELLEILVGSDGSTDGTVREAQEPGDPRVRVIAFPERRGKLAVLKDCAAQAQGDVLAFTDANTILAPDSLRALLRHFGVPSVGVVCGELRLRGLDGAPADEGLYWRYEKVLKILESRLNAALGANGAIYAVRRELFPGVPDDLITEDFVIPMKVKEAGFQVVYDPEAVATEQMPATLSDEFRRRMRIGAGNWQALGQCWRLLMPWKGFVSLAFWSHKVLRWFTPFLLLAALAAGVALAHEPLGGALLVVQGAAYASAAFGWLLRRLHVPAGPFALASYFVAINAAIGVGMIRGLFGLQRPAWQRTAREPVRTEGKR